MIELLVIIVSCKKHQHSWPKILNRQIENQIILCGGAEHTYLDGQILYLKCVDTYDGLSEKMLTAYEYIISTERFAKFTHILKADDHDTDITNSQIESICTKHAGVLEKHDYVGQEIVTGFFPTHHFGRVPKTCRWYNKKLAVPTVPYLSGGATYILSYIALKLLIQHTYEQQNYCSYEDMMMGFILEKYSIVPFVLNYGIKYWNG